MSVKNDLATIASALNDTNPGVFLREAAKTALGRVKEHVAFDRTQREYMEADFKALAEGKPVKTALAEAVAARITQEVAKARIAVVLADAEPRHVCGLSGYNPMIDPRCPACAARAEADQC